jgi:hypothetical protein
MYRSAVLAFSRWAPLALLMVLLAPHLALATVTGRIDSVGYDQSFRPGTWTPLTVSLQAESGDTGTYQIRIEQEDGDRDLVSFVRTITLTGSNSGTTQRFTTYFLPQGVNNGKSRGLVDSSQSQTIDLLNNQLRVYLCDARGNRISRLSVQSPVSSLENLSASRFSKLILCVLDRDRGSLPGKRDLSDPNLLGLNEDFAVVEISRSALPASTLGYDAVDAVIWAAGRPPDVNLASEEPQYRALRQYLSGGGRLVILQNPDWHLTEAWGELLPVTYPRFGAIQGVRTRNEANVMTEIIASRKRFTPAEKSLWDRLRGPFPVGLVKAKESASVEVEVTWYDAELLAAAPKPATQPANSEPGLHTPWLVRMPVGAGCVTYVAQDLSSNLLPLNSPGGWPIIWAKILDYRYDPFVVDKKTDPDEQAVYDKSSTGFNLGPMIYSRMNHSSTAGALVVLALVFFIAYWLAAGILSWVILVSRKRKEWAWLAFAAVGCGATLVTLVVVRVVLQGAPEIHHFTLVRVVGAGVGNSVPASPEPTVVESRIGLYVKRDGNVRIELPQGNADCASIVTPYAFHPRESDDLDDSPPFQRYEVGVPDVTGDHPASIVMPFRSTMKRLQVSWRGSLRQPKSDEPAGLSGSVAVAQTPNTLLSGLLLNATGRDLKNIVMVYRGNKDLTPGLDRMIFLPDWKDGLQLKLEDLTTIAKGGKLKLLLSDAGKKDGSVFAPEYGDSVYGLIGQAGRPAEWARWLRAQIRASSIPGEMTLDDSSNSVPRGYSLLSFFDRLPFLANTARTANTEAYSRAEIHRVNARFLDVSAAVSAGRLVILAEADGSPLPLPVSVDGTNIPGSGVTLYQFVLPLDRKYDQAPTEE